MPNDPEENQVRDKEGNPSREYDLISQHLDHGLDFIRHTDYRQANEFLTNRALARPIGIDISNALPLLLEPQDLTEENFPRLTYILTDGFWHRIGTKAIKVANIGLAELESKYPPRLLTRLYQEASLLSAEEWAHVLQFQQSSLGRGSYISQALIQDGRDRQGEIDIALYFNEKGIPLKGTQWETRYGRQGFVKF